MVQQLVASGANNIWEYTLVDPVQNRSNKKKPSPKDPIQSVFNICFNLSQI